jgi:hypothetical protein
MVWAVKPCFVMMREPTRCVRVTALKAGDGGVGPFGADRASAGAAVRVITPDAIVISPAYTMANRKSHQCRRSDSSHSASRMHSVPVRRRISGSVSPAPIGRTAQKAVGLAGGPKPPDASVAGHDTGMTDANAQLIANLQCESNSC